MDLGESFLDRDELTVRAGCHVAASQDAGELIPWASGKIVHAWNWLKDDGKPDWESWSEWSKPSLPSCREAPAPQ